MRDQDDQDYEREKKEQENFRNQQQQYFKSLNSQVKNVSNRKRFEDMMTDQERQLNHKDINAYENNEKVLYSNKIGFSNSPNKKPKLNSIDTKNPYGSGQSFGIQKKNLAQIGTFDIIAPSTGFDPTEQKRYINGAIKKALVAEKYNLRPVISNRAYGGDIQSRNNGIQHNNSVQNNYPALSINKSHDSVKRTGQNIMNLNAQSRTPYANRNISMN
mmetsp:Transcript_31873/g.28223  ORF Transcript_31873/g.28223 Transcript_31873/m.28223 type:complete len:216 (-) Transcript_31873:54-701(-)